MTDTAAMNFDQWLAYQQHTHSKSIDMTLERARGVAQRLALLKPARHVITVAGTNGKGSTVAFLQALLSACGLRVACYTSPHVLNYRERFCLPAQKPGDFRWASEAELIAAFCKIDAAREGVTLTFFEYATLAAWLIFAGSALDVAIFEVGLGGRLDTVNLIDADGVILTTVDLDHQDYLGTTRAQIGAEKAGVFRVLQTAVYSDREPVEAVLRMAERIGTTLIRPKRDYRFSENASDWRFQFRDRAELLLPKPTLLAPCQLDNAAAAVALIMAMPELVSEAAFNVSSIARAILQAQLPGRLAHVGANPAIYLDVAHNPQAAHSLARWLHAQPIFGRTLAVFGALEDKDALAVVGELKNSVQHWFLAGLDHETPRGMSAMALSARVRGATCGNYDSFHDTAGALDAAISLAKPLDRVLVFGSFFMVAAAYRALGIHELTPPRLDFSASQSASER
jgi:dihydrofolate synthase / folylpolyglutamate synthase